MFFVEACKVDDNKTCEIQQLRATNFVSQQRRLVFLLLCFSALKVFCPFKALSQSTDTNRRQKKLQITAFSHWTQSGLESAILRGTNEVAPAQHSLVSKNK